MRHDLKSPIVAAVSGTLAVNILPSGMRCGVETGMVRDQAGSARNGSAVAVSSSSSSHWVDNLVAGGTASLCSKLVLQPLDIAKTILQVIDSVGNLGLRAELVVFFRPTRKTIPEMVQTFQSEFLYIRGFHFMSFILFYSFELFSTLSVITDVNSL